MTTDVRFTVFGSLRAWRGDTELALGPRQQRLVLGLLLAREGHTVGISELAGLLWRDDRPASAVNTVHRYIGSLRRLLQPDLPARDGGHWLTGGRRGYRLVTPPGSLDLLAFRDKLAAARQATAAGDEQAAAGLYRSALALVNGRCVAEQTGGRNCHHAFAAVDVEVVAAARAAAESAIRTGESAALLPALRRVATLNPLDDALQARLMTLLAADGKQAEAFVVYEQNRVLRSRELGVEPGPESQAAYLSILRRRESATVRGTGETVPAALDSLPAQLPSDVVGFVGRTREMAKGTDHLVSAGSPILAVDGMPGVGKTTFGIHLARSLTPRFPDGQLYIDLGGFDRVRDPADPAEVLRGFLNALGVRDSDVPGGLTARAGLFRSLLSGRRMLLLLDNAHDPGQVRPLLPGVDGCAVVVTSRLRMIGLAATAGARLLTLGTPSPEEARRDLAWRLGHDRIRGQRDAVDEIVAACARLPLAVAQVAARAAAFPGVPLSVFAAETAEAAGTAGIREAGLSALPQDGQALRAAFALSCKALSPAAGKLFRLMSRPDTPELTREAVFEMAGLPPTRTRRLLTELADANLVVEHRPRRYRLHPLLRSYGREVVANGA